jgi:ubiquinol-cytochrome c reductase cytochrome c1 subunit
MFFLPAPVLSAGAEIALDHAPDRSRDMAALQHGARVFVSYCLNCHAASLMRYNRLRDLGFTDQQIRDELLYTTDRIGEPMKIAMSRADAQRWFGVAPPDLSLIARARTSTLGPGEDWVYTYLRSFYRDPTRPSGWNNVVFQNVAMHHVLWEFQGEQVLGADHRLRLARPGTLSPAQYDDLVADLVAYLKYMSEPSAQLRRHIGRYVLAGMFVLLFFAIILKPPRRKQGSAQAQRASQ